MLTFKQRSVLVDMVRLKAEGDPPDLCDFERAGTLAWINRERVITALMRKGYVDRDWRVTPAGRSAIGI